jgi:iron complex transport system substrate-binding protein
MPQFHRPVRIACLQPSATVILASVGALDRVVACTKYCAEVVPELDVSSRLVIADSWTAKTSEILSADPDLVIASVPYQQTAVAEILKAGVRFLGLAPHTLEDIYTDIWTIAACAGVSELAEKVIVDMKAGIDDIRKRAAHLPKKRVFCEEWGKPIIASQPWVAELIAATGGEFIGSPGKQCSSDDVASLDPEVIIAAWCGAGNRVPLEKIIRERNWSGTTASRNSQVYCISDELLNTPAPTLIAGLHALAAAIHPEIFGGDGNTPSGLHQITEVQAAQLNHSRLV